MYNTFQLNMTLKIHVIIHHYADYYELSGLTFWDKIAESSELIYSNLTIHEENIGFKVVLKIEIMIHQKRFLNHLLYSIVRELDRHPLLSLGLKVSL